MKKPPIGTPPREASEQRLAEEQAKRIPLPSEVVSDLIERLRAPVWPAKVARRELCDEAAAEIERLQALIKNDDETLAVWKDKQLRDAEAEIERLQAALRETREYVMTYRPGAAIKVIDAALSGKGET